MHGEHLDNKRSTAGSPVPRVRDFAVEEKLPDRRQVLPPVVDGPGPDVLDIRRQLFAEGGELARAAWGRELMARTEAGQGRQADLEFEGVLGLPHYGYHNVPNNERPAAPFDGLVPVKAERPDVNTPEPSRMEYLTPVTKALNLTAGDVVVDIGAGTGKACFWFGACTPAGQVIGIETEPAYAEFTNGRASDLSLSHVRFDNVDALNADLSPATAIYYYNPIDPAAGRDTLVTLAARMAELGSQKAAHGERLQLAIKGPTMQELLQDSGIFSAETVLEDPAVWMVFRNYLDASQ